MIVEIWAEMCDEKIVTIVHCGNSVAIILGILDEI